VPQARDNEYDG